MPRHNQALCTVCKKALAQISSRPHHCQAYCGNLEVDDVLLESQSNK